MNWNIQRLHEDSGGGNHSRGIDPRDPDTGTPARGSPEGRPGSPSWGERVKNPLGDSVVTVTPPSNLNQFQGDRADWKQTKKPKPPE